MCRVLFSGAPAGGHGRSNSRRKILWGISPFPGSDRRYYEGGGCYQCIGDTKRDGGCDRSQLPG